MAAMGHHTVPLNFNQRCAYAYVCVVGVNKPLETSEMLAKGQLVLALSWFTRATQRRRHKRKYKKKDRFTSCLLPPGAQPSYGNE